MPGPLACELLDSFLSYLPSCKSTGHAETHTTHLSITLIVFGPCACKCFYPLGHLPSPHVSSCLFLIQMKPDGSPSIRRATSLQSLRTRGLSARLPFPSGASVLLLKSVVLVHETHASPSSKLRTGGGLGWHRAMQGFFHGFECLSCWVSPQLCMSSQFTTAGVASPGAGGWGGLWWPFESPYKPE